MSYMAGVALRKFQQKYFNSIKRLVYSPSRKQLHSEGLAKDNKEKYEDMLKLLDADRRQRLKRGDRQFRMFIILLTLLPILAFILACIY